jgi:diacylglycerol kinase (ATP)
MGTVHLLANPASGRADPGDHGRVVSLVEAAGHDVVDLTGATLEESRRKVAGAEIERLIVVGGDGLLHLAVQVVAQSETVLGLVPQGSGNDFARALGLLDRPLDAMVAAALAPPVAVDAIRTNHGWVASVATLGFAGDVTARANRMKRPKGQNKYTLATLRQLPHLKALSLHLEVDGRAHDIETVMLSIGNTAYFGGGMKICPGAAPADGQVEVAIIGRVSRLTLLRVFPKVFEGAHTTHPKVTMLRGSCVRIGGDPSITVWADGEPIGTLPCELDIVPGALQVAGACQPAPPAAG